MKYVVPLFRPSWSNSPAGLANWDIFQDGFSVEFRGLKIVGVTWNSDWNKRTTGEQRKGGRRLLTDRRFGKRQGQSRPWSEGDTFQRVRFSQRRRQHNRRDHSERRICKINNELIPLRNFVRNLKSKRELSDHDVSLLLKVCSGVASQGAYKTWNAGQQVDLLGFAEQDWTPRDHFQKFQAYALASFFELLQPGGVYWKGPNPNVEQMEKVSRILHSLPRAPGNSRLKAIKAFVEGRTDLAGMHRILKLKLKHSPQALQLIWANRDIGPKAFYEKLCAELENFDIKLSSNSRSYPKQIERLKQKAEAFVKSL